MLCFILFLCDESVNVRPFPQTSGAGDIDWFNAKRQLLGVVGCPEEIRRLVDRPTCVAAGDESRRSTGCAGGL